MSKFKLPSFPQWKQIFKVLTKKEKRTFLTFCILAVASFVFLVSSIYVTYTKTIPTFGGTYTEGIVGQPRFINPVYGETNDIDRSLIDLVYSGLMKYDSQGKIVKDLADSYTISNDGKTYNFQLKKNVLWHDGKRLTADDIVFTIQTIQSSDYKSPLRANWIDVDVQKTSDLSLQFNLKAPYNSFLENCTVKILPSHIWADISPENFALSSYNVQPIGSGPFIFSNLSQSSNGFIKTLNLESNRKYYNHPSFIANLSFKFFDTKDALVKSANASELDGFTLTALDNNEFQAEKEIHQGWQNYKKMNAVSFSLPRYFAVFLNNKKPLLFSDANIRKALAYSVNKDELVKNISSETKTNITKVDSPILPDFFGYQQLSVVYSFDTVKASSLLAKAKTTKTPAFQFRNYLKVGSSGKDVSQLQACLSKLDEALKTILQNEKDGKYGSGTESAVNEFQKKYLPDAKPTGEVGAGTRSKLNELCTPKSSSQLAFTLTTINQPQLVRVANLLKDYWQSVGFQVTINAVSISDLKPIIKSRSYDALLYGEALGAGIDPYPFWYSSQKLDPGLNLSYYENKDADKVLKDAREALDENTKAQKLESAQNIILQDAPALFLYNPDYVYWVSANMKGIDTQKIIDPAQRFSNITNWYLKTRRSF